jgi:hypothetical protein
MSKRKPDADPSEDPKAFAHELEDSVSKRRLVSDSTTCEGQACEDGPARGIGESDGEDAERQFMEDEEGMRVEYMDDAECAFLYDEIFVRQAYMQHGIKFMESGDVLDVGANIGLFSLFCHRFLPQPCAAAESGARRSTEEHASGHHDAAPAAPAARPGRVNRVFAFEPVPAIFAVLARNLRNLPEMRLRPFGLAAAASAAECFRFYPDGPGESSRHLAESTRQRGAAGRADAGELVTGRGAPRPPSPRRRGRCGAADARARAQWRRYPL